MDILLIVLAVLVLLLVLYAFSVMGQHGRPGWERLRGWSYAHRGLHKEGVPENSMAAFRAALEKGYGIELDLHLLADGNLAVMHDYALARTTGAEGKIEDLITEQLKNYRLEGTEETIPTFGEVLDLFDGKAPMIVELKAAGNNAGVLVDTACKMLADYKGAYCMESFDPRCVLHLKKHYPHVIRGQLAENFFKSEGPLPMVLKCMLTWQLENFLIQPDFISYKFSDRKNLGVFLARKLWRVQGVAWTLKNQQQHDQAVAEGWIPIFEDYEP